MTTTITITNLGDELDVEFDPPDTSPHLAGPMFFKAAWCEAIRAACRARSLLASYATVPIK